MWGYLFIAIAGFTFGYILPGWPAFLPLVIPFLLFIGTGINEGFDGALLVRFAIAIAVAVLSVLGGRAVASARGDAPVPAEKR
jgi:hypothetical protein